MHCKPKQVEPAYIECGNSAAAMQEGMHSGVHAAMQVSRYISGKVPVIRTDSDIFQYLYLYLACDIFIICICIRPANY